MLLERLVPSLLTVTQPVVALLDRRCVSFILAAMPFKGLPHAHDKAIALDRFFQESVCAGADRSLYVRDIAGPCQHENRQPRPSTMDFLRQRHAIHAGHSQIGDNQVIP